MKKIEINDLEWTVIFTNHINSKDNDEYVFGTTIPSKLEIYIVKKIPKKLVRRTIIHELTHAYLFAFGYSPDTMNEENVCDFVESHASRILENTNYLMLHYERGTI